MTDSGLDRRDGGPGAGSQADALASGLGRRLHDPAWLARAAGAGLCLTAVGFVVAFVGALGVAGVVALVAPPLSMRIALALPPLIAVLAAGTVVGACLAWWHDYWSLAARLHQTLLAVLGIGFVWQLTALGFLP